MSAAFAVVLLGSLFGLAWYGIDWLPGHTPPGSGLVSTENGWHGLTVLRWLILLTVVAALGSVLLHVTQRSHGAKTSTSLAVAALGAVTAILLTYRVMINLPSPALVPDQKLGAVIGLLSAVGIALGGWQSVHDERADHGQRRTGAAADTAK